MAGQLCPKCKTRFQVLDDEQGMHACPHCGYSGHDENNDLCTQCGENEATQTDDGLCDECRDEQREATWAAHDEGRDWDEDWQIDGVGFADPGGRSALRAATADNPRIYACPTCKRPNRLTRIDKARGYQCDTCADALERGVDFNY